METLLELWMPILISAIAVWFASFLAWAVLPHHKKDYTKFPDQDKLMDFIRSSNAKAGQYIFPYCEYSDLKDPEMKTFYERGPHGHLNLWKGPASMGRNMCWTVVSLLIISIFVAYVTAEAREFGSDFFSVFQIATTVAFMAHCFGSILNDIWFRKPFRAVFMEFIDAIVFAAITGAIFAFMWPGAVGDNQILGS